MADQAVLKYLSIDTTFDPCYLSLDSTFNKTAREDYKFFSDFWSLRVFWVKTVLKFVGRIRQPPVSDSVKWG